MKRILLFYLVMQVLVTSADYYFTTHTSYNNASLNTTVLSWFLIAGNFCARTPDRIRSFDCPPKLTQFSLGNGATVMHQCRRTCAGLPNCKAYNVKFLQGDALLGKYNCSFFDLNCCDWQKASLHNTSTAGSQLWEKVEATRVKVTPCVEQCGVKYRGNCTKCGRTPGWTGLDCQIAPRFCADIPGALSIKWNDGYKIWPWGAVGQVVPVLCTKWGTQMLQTYYNGKYTGLIKLGSISYSEAMASYSIPNNARTLDWPLISAVLATSREKKLIVEINMDGTVETYNFTDVEVSPKGELSLTNNAGTTAFPPSLNKAPFVIPINANATCGPFWRFDPLAPNISVCTQRTRLMVFGRFMWDGVTANNYTVATFSFV